LGAEDHLEQNHSDGPLRLREFKWFMWRKHVFRNSYTTVFIGVFAHRISEMRIATNQSGVGVQDSDDEDETESRAVEDAEREESQKSKTSYRAQLTARPRHPLLHSGLTISVVSLSGDCGREQ
jgi:hypothetical protein